MPPVSISKALGFALTFSFRNAAAIVARVALPALIGWIISYASFSLYLTEIERYLGSPSERIASVVLGLVAAGTLGTLFLHSVIVAAVTALVLGLEDGGWKFFHIARREWRLYAANLRLLLVAGIWVGALLAVQIAAAKLSWPPPFGLVLDLLMAGGLGLLGVRFWFLAAPLSVAETQGQILRRAMRLSAGNSWRIVAIMTVVLLVAFAVEQAGEVALRAGGLVAPFPSTGSFAGHVAMFYRILLGILVVVGVAYLVGIVLLTAARVYVYRQLTEQTKP